MQMEVMQPDGNLSMGIGITSMKMDGCRLAG